MEQALMAVCKDIRLGKILIQTNHDTGEPEVGCPLHMCICFYIHLTKQKKTTSDTHHPDNWWKASFYFPVPPPCVASGRFDNLGFISGCSFQTDPLINCRLDFFCFWLLVLVSILQLHYLRLPKDISEDYVILMDSTVSTGAAALMAVRVLLVRPQQTLSSL